MLRIKNITEKGNITAIDESKSYPDVYHYDREGYGKGRAVGRLIKVTEEGITEFYKGKKKEEQKLVDEMEKAKKEYERDFEICYQWILQHCPAVQTVSTPSTDIYIISFPIPDHPSTICVVFEAQNTMLTKIERYSVYIWMFEGKVSKKSGDEWVNRGTTTYTIDKIEPLKVAAAWLKNHYRLEELEEKDVDVALSPD